MVGSFTGEIFVSKQATQGLREAHLAPRDGSGQLKENFVRRPYLGEVLVENVLEQGLVELAEG
ncbi:hypothetical protein D3C85_1668390 [compost metagenome]